MDYKGHRIRVLHMLVALLIAHVSIGQSKNQWTVVDNNKKFIYSDTSGVTQSYITYFGNAFTVPDMVTINGLDITQENLKGKIVIYNFWFVSCRPCVAEIPTL